MPCRKYRYSVSAFLDRELTKNEAVEYAEHIRKCPDCSQALAETRTISHILGAMASPQVPPELHPRIMNNLGAQGTHSDSRPCAKASIPAASRLASYAFGSAATVLLFLLTLAALRPIPLTQTAGVVDSMAVAAGGNAEYSGPSEPVSVGDERDGYAAPRVNTTSSLISFSQIAYNNPGSEAASALVEVSVDGRGRVVRMLEKPKDPRIVAFLEWSLSKQPFQPATISGHPVASRIVLMLEKMDVRYRD